MLVRIEASIQTPIVWRSALNLDGLTVWASASAAGVPTSDLQHTAHGSVVDRPDIPIARVTVGDHSVYMSSDMRAGGDIRFLSGHLTQKMLSDSVEFLGRRYNAGQGVMRDKLKRFSLAVVDRVYWLAYSDGPEALLELLRSHITSIGALRSQGYGRVREWSMSINTRAQPQDAVIANGEALRALPAAWCVFPELVTELPVSPPYFLIDNIVPAVPPGALAALKPEVVIAPVT